MWMLKREVILFAIIVYCSISVEALLNREDEDFFGHIADTYDWNKHPCNRKCIEGQEPRICKYVFVVEKYASMSKACYDCPYNLTDCTRPHCIPVDGFIKPVYVVNRQLPGPRVEVCENDQVKVEVRNMMLSESTTIHWHGFKQYGTPYSDGVPFVTQCPIQPQDYFLYDFNATTTGTFFWHSHIGNQRVDGLYGAMVVNPVTTKDVYKDRYDVDDHIIILSEWSQKSGDDDMAKKMYSVLEDPTTIVINGLGPTKTFQNGSNVIQTPRAIFNVKKGEKHRMRTVHAGSGNCPLILSIDNHSMIVISLDSNDIKEVEVDVITIWPGERVDFILDANKNIGNYWIRIRGFGICRINDTIGVFNTAILRYEGAELTEPSAKWGFRYPIMTNFTRVLNPYNAGTESSPLVNISIPNLEALQPNDESLNEKVDYQYFMEFDFYPIDNFDYQRKDLYGYNQTFRNQSLGTVQFNHITLQLQRFPLLSQWELIKPNTLCNSSTISEACITEQCSCTHVAQFKRNSVVELIFIDRGEFRMMNHPLHLHGHFFRVVATENLHGIVTADRIKQLDKEGKIKRRLDKAPIKDTMKAPSGGYTIVRVFADNPGYWFFHCHFEDHSNLGMAMIFKVGEHDEFPPKPENFPRCGDFVPLPM